jgi:hypothetical protein
MANAINFEYAQNLSENEAKFDKLQIAMRDAIVYFSKNTILQFSNATLMCDMMECHKHIRAGERSEFLYDKSLDYLHAFNEIVKDYETSGLSEKLQEIAKTYTELCLNK